MVGSISAEHWESIGCEAKLDLLRIELNNVHAAAVNTENFLNAKIEKLTKELHELTERVNCMAGERSNLPPSKDQTA